MQAYDLTILMAWARRAYEPALQRVINAKPQVITVAVVAVLLSGLLAPR